MYNNVFAQITDKSEEKPYVGILFGNKIYQNIIREILKSAYNSYQIAKWMSLFLFVIGVVFLGIAIFYGLRGDANNMVLILGGLGTANIIALFVYRPLERIQVGTNELAKSAIASLSFLAQYDYLAQYLVTMSGLAIDDKSRNLNLETERIEQLMKIAKEYVVALNTKAG